MAEKKDKAILVTGCSSGIGYCVANGLQARGYRVFASARKEADVDRLHAEGHESLQLDLDDEASIKHAVDYVLRRTENRLYGLFNNGAYGQPGAVEDLPTEALRAQFQTNLFGWHDLTRRLLPVMRNQGYGRIIQNSSVLGFAAMRFRGAYNASKFALEGLSDTLRLELHGTDIHVSLIEPGPILSRFRAHGLEKWRQHIDAAASPHRDHYQAMETRLKKDGPAVPFTLPPEAVLEKVVKALESPRPRARYYVTFPTYLFGYLKRILPTSALDALLRRV